jgi:hypothetical protein
MSNLINHLRPLLASVKLSEALGLVFSSIATIPTLCSNPLPFCAWQLLQMASFRAGFCVKKGQMRIKNACFGVKSDD